MKKNKEFSIILIALITLITGVFFVGFAIGSIYEESNQPELTLPKDYKKLNSNSDVIVQYDSIRNTIIIEHDNSIQFKWEGLITTNRFTNLHRQALSC